jgi:acetyl-CoA carboxylase biotin carboxylase subunit
MQVAIARGERLSLDQHNIKGKGHAIECRIYAEDPDNGFLPSPGLIRSFRVPGGPFVRLDSGVFEGAKVPIYYDPIIAKLIVWDETRPLAIKRMVRALGELKIRGIRSNVSFLLDVIQSKAFQAGDYDTRFLDTHWPELKEESEKELPPEDVILATAATVRFRQEEIQRGLGQRRAAGAQASFWRYTPWKALR